MNGTGKKQGYSFGTFKGVFTPSVLTIFGVIMYLRFGWVVGNVGIAKTLLIVTLATSITFLTGLSISAMATNMKVGTAVLTILFPARSVLRPASPSVFRSSLPAPSAWRFILPVLRKR